MRVHFITVAIEDDGVDDASKRDQYLPIREVLEHMFKDPPAGTRCVVLGTDTHACGDRKLNLKKFKEALGNNHENV